MKRIMLIALSCVCIVFAISLNSQNDFTRDFKNVNLEVLVSIQQASGESGGGSGRTCYVTIDWCIFWGCYDVAQCGGSCPIMSADSWSNASTC